MSQYPPPGQSGPHQPYPGQQYRGQQYQGQQYQGQQYQGQQDQGQQPYPGQQQFPGQPGPQDPPPRDDPALYPGGGGQPMPYGQGSGQPVPMGTVALTIQGSVMTSNMITPTVLVNGHRIQTRYGLQHVPVPAGPVHVEAYAQWMRTYGQAALDFTLAPGQTVPVFYAAPMHQFTTGLIGHVQQPRKGIGAFVTLMAVIAGITVLMILMVMVLTVAS